MEIAKSNRKVKWDGGILSREWKSTLNGAFSKLNLFIKLWPFY